MKSKIKWYLYCPARPNLFPMWALNQKELPTPVVDDKNLLIMLVKLTNAMKRLIFAWHTKADEIYPWSC